MWIFGSLLSRETLFFFVVCKTIIKQESAKPSSRINSWSTEKWYAVIHGVLLLTDNHQYWGSIILTLPLLLNIYWSGKQRRWISYHSFAERAALQHNKMGYLGYFESQRTVYRTSPLQTNTDGRSDTRDPGVAKDERGPCCWRAHRCRVRRGEYGEDGTIESVVFTKASRKWGGFALNCVLIFFSLPYLWY